jgi:hypothetical protein
MDPVSLARRLTALSDRVFAALAETAMPIAPELAETLPIDLVRVEIAAFERARAVAPMRSPEVPELDRARERVTEEMLRRAPARRDREPALGPLRAAARRLDVALDEADDDWRALAVVGHAGPDRCEPRARASGCRPSRSADAGLPHGCRNGGRSGPPADLPRPRAVPEAVTAPCGRAPPLLGRGGTDDRASGTFQQLGTGMPRWSRSTGSRPSRNSISHRAER